MIHFDLPQNQSSIIKVFGVGGGGNNAVNYMYNLGIEGVDFVVCNTDSQALAQSPIPNKIQLGPHLTQGLGAGANPEIGKQACEESVEDVRRILEVNTKMAFITAGMGGGTGTGGAPIVAKICRELGILTVGIVTTPFSYEGRKRLKQAEEGIQHLKQYVDTILIISNDKLRHQFGNLNFTAAFSKADDILATATKCITDVINSTGQINVDFADVCTVMRNGGVAILGSSAVAGENRAQEAVEQAMNSPLLNDNDIKGAKWILLNITSAQGEHEHTLDEMDIIQAYVQTQAGDDCDVILGVGFDNALTDKLGVTIIATGFEQKAIVPTVPVSKKIESQFREEDKIVFNLVEEPVKEERKEEPPVVPTSADPYQPTLVEIDPVTADSPNASSRLEDIFKPSTPVYTSSAPAGNNNVVTPGNSNTAFPNNNGYSNGAGGYNNFQNNAENPFSFRQVELFSDPSPAAQTEADIEAEFEITLHEEDEAHTDANGDYNIPNKIGDHILSQDEIEERIRFEQQKKSLEERAERLRRMSFNVKNLDNNNLEVENVPAYMRKNKQLDDPGFTSNESYYSGYSVEQPNEQNHANINTLNTFLNGKKPD
jgi:cell division protein FtsZ